MKNFQYILTPALILTVIACSQIQKPTNKAKIQSDQVKTEKAKTQSSKKSSRQSPSINWTEVDASRHLTIILNGLSDLRLDSGEFISEVEDLGENFKSETSTHIYEITVEDPESFAYVTAIPKTTELTSFVGGVMFEPGLLAFNVCKSDVSSQSIPPAPIRGLESIECPDGFTEE